MITAAVMYNSSVPLANTCEKGVVLFFSVTEITLLVVGILALSKGGLVSPTGAMTMVFVGVGLFLIDIPFSVSLYRKKEKHLQEERGQAERLAEVEKVIVDEDEKLTKAGYQITEDKGEGHFYLEGPGEGDKRLKFRIYENYDKVNNAEIPCVLMTFWLVFGKDGKDQRIGAIEIWSWDTEKGICVTKLAQHFRDAGGKITLGSAGNLQPAVPRRECDD